MFTHQPSFRRFVSTNSDGSIELRDDEKITFELEGVELSFDATSSSPGCGKVIVTTSRIIWQNECSVYDFDVPYIVLHAITTDTTSFPKPCLYCQFDEEREGESVECFMAPADPKTDLQALFDAFSVAALNNPDPPEEGEQEGDDNLIFNEQEVKLGAEQAKRLAHFESVFQLPGSES
jgi:hypothetical protein